jgi:hypothetical protein
LTLLSQLGLSSKGPEIPQKVRQVDLRVEFPLRFLSLDGDPLEGGYSVSSAVAFSGEPFLDGALAGCGSEGVKAGKADERDRPQDGIQALEGPSLRRRLDAAFESCNRGMAAWIGGLWSGLLKRRPEAPRSED